MMKIFGLLLLTSFSGVLFGQTNYDKFKKLYKNNDTSKIEALLSEWKQADPNDPELYTSAFNYYYSHSRRENISITKEQAGAQTFQLQDSTGKISGYLGANVSYNSEILNKAFDYINRGIEKFPNRLDIRFGKCYVLQQIGDYENFTNEVIKTVEYSNVIHNSWLWTENKKLEDPVNFMLGSVQTYLKNLYDTEDDSLLQNMLRIGDVTLKYYPDKVEILSTTAVASMLTKNYDKALIYLKRAETINPEDFIVLNNIAQAYKLKDDKLNAIKYYRLMDKYGDQEAKQQAKEEIRKLTK